MDEELFNHKDYTLISVVSFPVHNPSIDSDMTTLYVFDISDKKADELDDLSSDFARSRAITSDLDVWDNLEMSFRAEKPEPNIVLLYATETHNV